MSEAKYEEAKRDFFRGKGFKSGIQLWGIGHSFRYNDYGYNFKIKGDIDEDADAGDIDEDEEQARESYELVETIMDDDYAVSGSLGAEAMKKISDSPLLRQTYNNRWYRYNNNDTYFVMINNFQGPIKAGEQLCHTYGSKSN